MWSVGRGVTHSEPVGLIRTIWYLTSTLVVVGVKELEVLRMLGDGVQGVEGDVCLCDVVRGLVG